MEMREKILASAQRLLQQRGFNGFSYADVANEVGIRKASLHHHFPTKADLGATLIEQYSKDVGNALDTISRSALPGNEKLAAYASFYRGSLESERMCLGGMLATEVQTLDANIIPGVKHFFTRNVEWLTEVLTEGVSQQVFTLSGSAIDHARILLSAFQGALLVARATGDHYAFDQTTALLISSLMRSD